ncbi:MAG: type III-B CRISPR module RAMP protein Cmr6 [Armatimonadota bacterium]|nr:type III-B CRISPR module RAMP protein Cmr6 [Armatimonadota bacterium]
MGNDRRERPGRGHKERFVPLPSDTLRMWEQWCRAKRKSPNLHLLVNQYGAFESGPERREEHKKGELSDLLRKWDSGKAAKIAQAVLRRREAYLEEVCAHRGCAAVRLKATSCWRAVTGMGDESVFKTALTLDELGGFPVVRGSAIKGMTRHYVEHWLTGEEAVADEAIDKVFGKPPDPPEDLGSIGAVQFLGGIPEAPIGVELDIMTPHYPDWYQKGPTDTPSDWCNPTQIYFLAIPAGQQFVFDLVGEPAAVGRAREWVRDALETIGVGAKTAAGYGYFTVQPEGIQGLSPGQASWHVVPSGNPR